MANRRKVTPKLSDIPSHPDSDARCWFCGQTRNVPAGKYDGFCMSCYLEFQEDDIAMELWGVEAMV
jgi:hypothetical protein